VSRTRLASGVAFLALTLLGGCGWKRDPVLAPASGTVTHAGKPLAHVLVRFMPAERGIAPEWISEGTTDQMGRFVLVSARGPGAVVGKHRVTVSEGPVPDDIREDQARVTDWLRTLDGRPLPERFGTSATSPLEATVDEGGSSIDFELSR